MRLSSIVRTLVLEERIKLESYDDVGIDYIKSSKPKLNQQKGFDDKQVIGRFTYLYFSRPEDDFYLWGDIVVFDNEDGTEVANSGFGKEHEDDPLKAVVDVRSDKRRKGIATNIYKWIEKLTGEILYPDLPHSDSAAKFWDQPDRPFGVR